MPRTFTPRKERTIRESRSGRVFWKTGQQHPLDVLFTEANTLQEDIPHQLRAVLLSAQHLQSLLAPLLMLDIDLEELEHSLATADHAALASVADRFADRKHVAHLEAVFAVLRRKRLLGRLHAIQAALDLTTGLLADEQALSYEYLQSVLQQEAIASPPSLGSHLAPHPETAASEEAPTMDENDQEPGVEQTRPRALSKEEQRLRGIDEPLAPLVASAKHSRELLRTFEAHLPKLRAQLIVGDGWFDTFYIRKKHLKEAVKTFRRALRKEQERGIAVPQEIEQAVHPEVAQVLRQGGSSIPKHLRDAVYDYSEYGPYVKYRWQHNKHIYTISMGLQSDYPEGFFVW